jgi:Ran GTPase-activating protein (RanGAP) involved in mRNA processing and transport
LLLADAIPEIQTKGFSLDLRENNISDVGIQAMTESVSQCLSMVSLRIEGNLEEESTPRIKKMEHHLRQHKKILQREYLFSTILRLEESCLHLNYCYIDHIPISIFDAELLARALQRNVSTIELRLQNNSLPMEGTKRILKSLHSNRTLHSLSFIDNNIGNGGMESVRILIRESTTLKKIQITNMIHTTPENGLQIFSLRTASRLYRSLAYHSSLTSLTLANCGLDDDRIGALVPAIAWRGIMEYLDIRNNPFSDHSVYVFCEMLQRCARLFHLDVVSVVV